MDSSSMDTPLPAEEVSRVILLFVVMLAEAAEAELVVRFDENRKQAINSPENTMRFVFIYMLNTFIITLMVLLYIDYEYNARVLRFVIMVIWTFTI